MDFQPTNSQEMVVFGRDLAMVGRGMTCYGRKKEPIQFQALWKLSHRASWDYTGVLSWSPRVFLVSSSLCVRQGIGRENMLETMVVYWGLGDNCMISFGRLFTYVVTVGLGKFLARSRCFARKQKTDKLFSPKCSNLHNDCQGKSIRDKTNCHSNEPISWNLTHSYICVSRPSNKC